MIYWLKLLIFTVIFVNITVFLVACIEFFRKPDEEIIEEGKTDIEDVNSSKQSVILFHGFGGTSYDFSDLIKELSLMQYNVIAPETPYQSRNHFAYARGRFTPDDYIKWASDQVETQYRITGKPPIVIGFSMGGTLSVLACENLPIKKLILIAPFFSLKVLPYTSRPTARLLKWIMPVVPKISKGQIFNGEGYRKYRPGSYLVSMSAFYNLEKLKRRAQIAFRKLKMPILLITSVHDRVVSFDAARKFGLRMKNCNVVYANHSNHILLHDNDADYITQRIVRFINVEM